MFRACAWHHGCLRVNLFERQKKKEFKGLKQREFRGGGVRWSCVKTFWSGRLEREVMRKDKTILSAMNVYWLRCIVLTSFIYQLNLNELCNVSKYFSTWASTIHFHNFSLFFDRRVGKCVTLISCVDGKIKNNSIIHSMLSSNSR